MSGEDVPIGAAGEASIEVAEADLASALNFAGGDVYPRVFATSRMIALMEIAASRAMNRYLDPGQLSVGVTVDIEHTAPTPHGARVVARSRLVERQGKLLVFEVIAEDETGEIGRGRHKRAVVEDARLVAGAERRRRS